MCCFFLRYYKNNNVGEIKDLGLFELRVDKLMKQIDNPLKQIDNPLLQKDTSLKQMDRAD